MAEAIASRRLPVEFALVRHEPQPYPVVDAICWSKMMAFGLGGNWEDELVRARLVARLGPEKAARLEPLYHEGQPLAVEPGADYQGLDAAVRGVLAEYERLMEVTGLEVLARGAIPASNNWVIAPQRSATGRAILCDDPHLPLQVPAVWYLNHLSGGEYEVAGASLVGLPGVVVGHNRDIVWGVTNGMTDVQDLYIERFHPDDPTQVWYEGRWEAATVREEVIRVRGRRKPVVEPLLFTRHGPVLCADWGTMGGDWLRQAGGKARKPENGPTPARPHAGISLRWVAHQPGHTCRAMLRLNRAQDWATFTAALAEWTEPAQNFVYADTQGNIGYTLAGRIPVRAAGQGLLPVPGWEARHEWTGVIPFEELPHTYNPPRGFIATANNRVVAHDYRYYLSNEWNSGYRARRITEFLQAREQISLDDCAALQNDVISLPARAVAHLIARRLRNADFGLRNDDGPAESMGDHAAAANSSQSALMDVVLELLAAWDGAMTVDSAAATISEYLLADLQTRVFGLAIGDPTLLANYNGTSTQPVLPTTSYGIRSLPLLIHLLAEADPAWLQAMAADASAPVPTWDDLLRASLAAVCARLRRKLGGDPHRWVWGRVHRTRFSHALGRVPPLGRVFDAGPVATGGSRDTVNSSAVLLDTPGLVAAFGAAFRLIADVGEWDAARVLIAPGQSGHPASPQYRPHVEAWRQGLYHQLPFSPAAVAAAAVYTLTIAPDEKSVISNQ
jgi:penicillin amidase